MRVVLQRVRRASVTVGGDVVSSIGPGICLLVGVEAGDGPADALAMADKVADLRVFGDGDGRMNLSLADVGGEVLVVSQFTLLGDVRRGRRPSFTRAAPPEVAEPIIETIAARLSTAGLAVAQGVFGSKMDVELVNDGPVTLVMETLGGAIR